MHRPHTSFLAAATGLLLFVGAVDQDTSSIADTPDFNAPGRSDHELRSFASPLKCLLCSDSSVVGRTSYPLKALRKVPIS
jgi:hypothetical protein